ncbi:hypothetical protein Bca52824_039151 [Brassica carinata]|uniref:Peptidase S54 rhomboid domain-containing protein n=1 Tax=Brassica carinata TaxID=52824 RepID=A0A8X7RQV5_BRACI|nr:hypothetical protein Bca52824_039151 [Brassica carinata]
MKNVNSLIDRGQLWRLATSSVLHANPMHLMINCYSLNSIGPTAESLGGPTRFLAVYFTSAIASSAMSSWLNKAPSVGSVAVFVMRHKQMVRGGNENLMQIDQTLGLVSRGIDNWGHDDTGSLSIQQDMVGESISVDSSSSSAFALVNVILVGLPAIVLPCGLVEGGSSGLLVVFQMIGEAFDEEKFLKVGHIFEQTLRGSGFVLPTLPNVA